MTTIATNICNEKLKLYHDYRSRLIGLSDESANELKLAQEILTRHEPFSTPADKLRADSYTLVLIGGFQSGKSTLFNYLCDGRELSPVGPCGGGIRTSGCMVTAHPAGDGEAERAIVTWRAPEELLAALGTPLIRYFEEPTSYSALTPREVNLDKDADRDKLAKLAIQVLTDPKSNPSDEDTELLRFTLLVCRFYKDFEQRCKTGRSECTPDETVKLTSYPQDWDSKWWNTQENGTWADLPEFSAEEVQFAFCGGVELFLDSPILRNIGCSIIDCPGLFISKWDTEIASRCIRESNAILFMIKGETQLSQEAITALQECVRMGGAHKIIFGANLRKNPVQWNRVLQQGVLPQLKRNGFSEPVVHNFHAGIALRMRELMYEEFGMLSQPSRAAIEYDIELEGMPRSVKEYLSNQLEVFVPMMTFPEDKKLADYADNYDALAQLSGVLAFVGAASNHVLETRASSVLIHEGTRKLRASLSQAKAELEDQIELLNDNVEAAEKKLEAVEKKLDEFRKSKELHVNSLSSQHNEAVKVIYEHYQRLINEKIGERRGVLIDITAKHIPPTIKTPWLDRNKLIEEYSEAVGNVLSDVLSYVKKEVEEKFISLPAVGSLKDAYEGHRAELMDKLAGFRQFESITDSAPQFPDSFTNAVMAMVLPRVISLMENVIDEQRRGWLTYWLIMPFIAPNPISLIWLFTEKRKRAEWIVNKCIDEFKNLTYTQLWCCLEQDKPAGPVTILHDKLAEFKQYFNDAEQEISNAIDTAKRLQDSRKNKANIVPILKKRSKNVEQLLGKCHNIGKEIHRSFPEPGVSPAGR